MVRQGGERRVAVRKIRLGSSLVGSEWSECRKSPGATSKNAGQDESDRLQKVTVEHVADCCVVGYLFSAGFRIEGYDGSLVVGACS